jgi:paraquat-inducible protein A
MTAHALTGSYLQKISCPRCEGLNGLRPDGNPHSCLHCGHAFYHRKPQSLQRASAFLLSACILLVPANVLPVLISATPFKSESDTIIGGIQLLLSSKAWPLAILVFFASIVVPFSKIGLLLWLIVASRFKLTVGPMERAKIYRLLEFFGRWSMLDVYVVAILVALVQIPGLASVQAGPGALAFAAVVILTMLATQSFDPRLNWTDYDEH